MNDNNMSRYLNITSRNKPPTANNIYRYFEFMTFI